MLSDALDERKEEGRPGPDRRRPAVNILEAGGAVPLEPTNTRALEGPVRSADADDRVFRKFFRGGGALSEALRQRGLPVLAPVEILPNGLPYRADRDLRGTWVVRREQQRARAGWYLWAHFIPPGSHVWPAGPAG